MSYLAQFDSEGTFIGVLSEHQALLNEDGPYVRIPLPLSFDPSVDTVVGTPDSFQVKRIKSEEQSAKERILAAYPPSLQISIICDALDQVLQATNVPAHKYTEMREFIRRQYSE